MSNATMEPSRKKTSIFAIAVGAVILLVALLIGWSHLTSKYAPSVDSGKLTAGEHFDPEYKTQVYGSETSASLDGLDQVVTAVNPSTAWKKAFPNSKCVEDKKKSETTCVAPAPQKLKVPDGMGYKLNSIMAGFGVKEGLAGLGGMLLLGALLWLLVFNDDHR